MIAEGVREFLTRAEFQDFGQRLSVYPVLRQLRRRVSAATGVRRGIATVIAPGLRKREPQRSQAQWDRSALG